MYILEVQSKTLFIKLRDVYPECEFLIHDSSQLYPFKCLVDHCPRNSMCMDKLVKRVKYIFDAFPDSKLLLLYFSYRDKPGSQRAGIFWREMSEPRYITMNRAGWEKLKEIGKVYEWELPDSLFLEKAQVVHIP